jgi:predicted NBD/HSP70 family sugar kinase
MKHTQMIYDQDVISRADIARETNLTRTTVSSIVADLMDEGLVVETGIGPSEGGKPPRLLGIVENARQLLCLDLSSSCFREALVNLRGDITCRVEEMVNGRTGAAALSLIYDLIDQLLAETTTVILGIGLGTPGLVDTSQGVVRDAFNLDWHDVPLKSLLDGRYPYPVYIANDSHLAALAAYTFSDQESQNLVLIKAGRGIGAGIVLNGELHYGDGFSAGEIGHVSVVEVGELCSCGNYGCLETVASVRSILQQVTVLHGALQSPTWEDILAAAEQGDETIQAILRQAGMYMGTAVAHLVGILNVRHIVIAGPISRAGQPFLDGVRTAVNQRVLPAMAAETEIGFANLGDDIVLLGASALVLNYRLGII